MLAKSFLVVNLDQFSLWKYLETITSCNEASNDAILHYIQTVQFKSTASNNLKLLF